MNAPNVDIGIDWKLRGLPPPDGPTFVSTFACGGGSSMGYRLAGWRGIGFCEVDPRMAHLYEMNLGNKDSYIGDIRKLIESPDLIPESWFNADVLDGSPPCTVFSPLRGSMGKRGAKKRYAEGAITQSLDDLFAAYLGLVELLRPRVFIAENVTGMMAPANKGYLAEISSMAKRIGYRMRVFKVCAARHGVAQIRKRLFFVGARGLFRELLFKERKPVRVGEACKGAGSRRGGTVPLTGKRLTAWRNAKYGERIRGGAFAGQRLDPKRIASALGALRVGPYHWDEPRFLNYDECARLQSFPDDYDFGKQCGQYVYGMSVPPFLARDVALAVQRHLLE